MARIVNGQVVRDDDDEAQEMDGFLGGSGNGGGGSFGGSSNLRSPHITVNGVNIHPAYLLVAGLFFFLTMGWKGLVVFLIAVGACKAYNVRNPTSPFSSSTSSSSSSSSSSASGSGRPGRGPGGGGFRTISDYPKPKGG